MRPDEYPPTDPGTEASIRDMVEALFLTPEQRLPAPYYQDEFATLYHGDCRALLPLFGSFDLLCTDPPYGLRESRTKVMSRGGKRHGVPVSVRDYGEFTWDQAPITDELLFLCRTKARQHIIFGGNYYPLPPTSCWLVWDKLNAGNDFADCELAWTNLKQAVRIKRHLWNGMARAASEPRFHPTQKPLALMVWCLGLAPGTVLDPFAGSGTTLVAAKQLGRKSVGIEMEERYCAIAAERLAGTTPSLFAPLPPKPEQLELYAPTQED